MGYISYVLISVVVMVHVIFAVLATSQARNFPFKRSAFFWVVCLIWLVPFFGPFKANHIMNPQWSGSSGRSTGDYAGIGDHGNPDCGGVDGSCSE